MNATCRAVKPNGEVCNKNIRNGRERCGAHVRSMNANGPNNTAVRELHYIQKREFKQLREEWKNRIDQVTEPFAKERLYIQENYELELRRLANEHAIQDLTRRQQAEIQRTGIDPDEEPNARKQQAILLRRQRAQERARAILEQRLMLQGQNIVMMNNLQQNNVNNNLRNDNELQRMAQDNQNVHTTIVVNQTKELVERLLKIPVPEEYRWNMNICSKTPGDIINHCKLTPKATWQMSSKYCQNEEIYGLGSGIYGKVLDAVWQYTLNSPNKNDICVALKQEMEDNIGMCAQGNLSRLCNILAGHMEGIIAQESPVSIIGRKLPKLMEIEDIDERIKQAYSPLIESGMPEADWDTWLKVLIQDQLEDEEDEEYYRFDRIKDSNNNIIGLKLDISYTINYDN
jgi:hypothetical protein